MSNVKYDFNCNHTAPQNNFFSVWVAGNMPLTLDPSFLLRSSSHFAIQMVSTIP